MPEGAISFKISLFSGAKLPPDGRVSHEFYVNMHPSNPYCQNIDGVLAAYKSCISQVQLYGPTNFAPTINHVANIARQFRDGSQYFILLILTDGVISDMPQTKTVSPREKLYLLGTFKLAFHFCEWKIELKLLINTMCSF